LNRAGSHRAMGGGPGWVDNPAGKERGKRAEKNNPMYLSYYVQGVAPEMGGGKVRGGIVGKERTLFDTTPGTRISLLRGTGEDKKACPVWPTNGEDQAPAPKVEK